MLCDMVTTDGVLLVCQLCYNHFSEITYFNAYRVIFVLKCRICASIIIFLVCFEFEKFENVPTENPVPFNHGVVIIHSIIIQQIVHWTVHNPIIYHFYEALYTNIYILRELFITIALLLNNSLYHIGRDHSIEKYIFA